VLSEGTIEFCPEGLNSDRAFAGAGERQIEPTLVALEHGDPGAA